MKKIIKNYKNKKVLVTGSTGFKGSWLCYWLYNLGAKVVGVGLKPEKNSILFNELKLKSKIKQKTINIQNFKKINQLIKKEKPQIIFHLAAQSIVSLSYKKPLETFRTNILGSANILESVRVNNIPNLVYITSDKCYLNLDKKSSYKETDYLGGLDNYSSSKASAEIIFRSYLNSYKTKNKSYLNYASARAGNVIGGGDMKDNRLIPDLVKSIQRKDKIKLRSPNATRPWQHVLEPLSGYLILGEKLMNKKLKSNIHPCWNFGPEKKNCKTVKKVVDKFLSNFDKKVKIKILKEKKKFHEAKFLSLSILKAKKELKWKPKLSFDQTLKLTSDWYKHYLAKNKIEEITANQIKFFSDKV